MPHSATNAIGSARPTNCLMRLAIELAPHDVRKPLAGVRARVVYGAGGHFQENAAGFAVRRRMGPWTASERPQSVKMALTDPLQIDLYSLDNIGILVYFNL
jgi:hypothetical protein